MQALSEKFMSDEETYEEDCNPFVKRTLTWRSENLNELIKKLDHRYMSSREKKDRSKPLKVRKLGLPSERLPPLCAPKWAINATDNIDMNMTYQAKSKIVSLFLIAVFHLLCQSLQIHPDCQSLQIHLLCQSLQIHPDCQSLQIHLIQIFQTLVILTVTQS